MSGQAARYRFPHGLLEFRNDEVEPANPFSPHSPDEASISEAFEAVFA
jgi:hypothetical protein